MDMDDDAPAQPAVRKFQVPIQGQIKIKQLVLYCLLMMTDGEREREIVCVCVSVWVWVCVSVCVDKFDIQNMRNAMKTLYSIRYPNWPYPTADTTPRPRVLGLRTRRCWYPLSLARLSLHLNMLSTWNWTCSYLMPRLRRTSMYFSGIVFYFRVNP